MQRYPLAPPPQHGGIYQISNHRTGHTYVGQTTNFQRRFTEWRAAVSSGFGHTNKTMHDALKVMPDLKEWEIVIVLEMPGAPTGALLLAEAHHISNLQKHLAPGLLLNTVDQSTGQEDIRVYETTGSVQIRMPDGTPISQKQAAELMGVNADNLKKKVRWFKEQGVVSITTEELSMDRRQALQKLKMENRA